MKTNSFSLVFLVVNLYQFIYLHTKRYSLSDRVEVNAVLKFSSNLILVFTYFDEIFGPQILELYPYQHSLHYQDIVSNLSILLDVSAASVEESWRFLYADESFASQNIRLTFLNDDARGGLSELMLSVVLVPPHPQHIAAMAHDWNNIFQLQKLIQDEILFEKTTPIFQHPDEIKDFMHQAYEQIKERMMFFLESLEPGAHEID